MAFRYSFQQIVNLKNAERTQAEWVLVDSIGKLRHEEHSLSELHSLKVELGETITRVCEVAVSISQMTLLHSYNEHLDRQIEIKHRDVQTARRVVSEKRDRLSEKMVDEKVWTKAREQAYQVYNADMLRKEQITIDEMATNRYKRMQ